MEKDAMKEKDPAERMKAYLGKIASGPRMSKDLSQEEAEDGLSLILNEQVSIERAAAFFIASRMKLETVEENIGFWRALDKSTVKQSLLFDRLLQLTDPYDGFNRVPYFGFYVFPVLAALGLPAYGHSSASLPPKFGITFEDILSQRYYALKNTDGKNRIELLEKHRFGYLNTAHTHPRLERLRNLREEIVKRPMLATVEKMLMPVKAKAGGNFLASGYFHKGYEVPMMAIAQASEFDQALVGNGAEGTTLYGVHKPARVFHQRQTGDPQEIRLTIATLFSPETADEIASAYAGLKDKDAEIEFVCHWGEAALSGRESPAGPLIACQAATLCHLFGVIENAQEGFDQAQKILRGGKCFEHLMDYVERLQ
jgi:anthranilate phosphoribosyltransferase